MINLAYISTLALSYLELFSRAGGGGSSSGGSSSGGSSSGGGTSGRGSIIYLAAVAGYMPMFFICSVLHRKLSTQNANIVCWIILAVYVPILILVFKLFFGIIASVCAFLGLGSGLYGWFDKIMKLAKITKKKQAEAVAKDKAWEVNALNNQVSNTFYRFQTDWSNNDGAAMQSYLSPWYLYHSQLMILALKQLGRRNIVNQPKISELNLVDIHDEENNSNDYFIMGVAASSIDDLYDEKNNSLLFEDKNSFIEFWRFVRSGDGWLLDGISQTTEDINTRNNALVIFAQSHNYCYSSDWGWLLLPSRGQLFKGGKFGTSDINNHVIGIYNNILIQLYNYVPTPNNTTNGKANNYIIAQVALPKTYGNIVVRKKHLLDLGIKGLTKITMEWGDFNKKYEVWASDMERVTSFELLNPSFMVKLQELSFEVNIEVVDNIVYLYSNKTVPSPENYEKMLSILQQAFKEMRM